MMEEGLVLEADILEAELTKKITDRVTQEVTEKVTQEVTEQITQEVTESVTQRNQKEIICKLFSKLKDTNQVAELLDISTDIVQKAVQ